MNPIINNENQEAPNMKFEMKINGASEETILKLIVFIPQDIYNSNLGVNEVSKLCVPPALERLEHTIGKIRKRFESGDTDWVEDEKVLLHV